MSDSVGSKEHKELGRKIMAGSLSGMLANGLYLITRLFLTPFILAYVSLAHFGLWSVCFIVLSYAGLSAFGVNNAYIKYVAEYDAAGNQEGINTLMSTGLASMTLLCGLLFAGFSYGVPLIVGWLGITPELERLADVLIIGTAAAFLFELCFGAFKGLLEGLQQIPLVKATWLAAALVETLLVLLFLPLGFGIEGVLYAYMIKTVLEVLINAVLAFKYCPGLGISPRYVRREALNALFVFGGKVQVLGLLGIFMSTFDRIVVTAMLGLGAMGLYEVGRKLPFTARTITSATFAPFLPAASSVGGEWRDSPWPTFREKVEKYGGLALLSLWGSAVCAVPLFAVRLFSVQGTARLSCVAGLVICAVIVVRPGNRILSWFRDFMRPGEQLVSERLTDYYLAGCRQINLINFILYGFMLAAGSELLLAWVGPGYDRATPILLLVAVSSLVHMATGAGTLLFRGVNRAGRELEYTLITLVLSIIWIPALAALYGLVGAVWAAAVSIVAGSTYFIWRTNLAFRIGWREYCVRTLLPGLGPVLAGIPVFMALSAIPTTSRWAALGEVLFFGALYLVLCGLILHSWFLREEERPVLRSVLRSVVRKLGSRGG